MCVWEWWWSGLMLGISIRCASSLFQSCCLYLCFLFRSFYWLSSREEWRESESESMRRGGPSLVGSSSSSESERRGDSILFKVGKPISSLNLTQEMERERGEREDISLNASLGSGMVTTIILSSSQKPFQFPYSTLPISLYVGNTTTFHHKQGAVNTQSIF